MCVLKGWGFSGDLGDYGEFRAIINIYGGFWAIMGDSGDFGVCRECRGFASSASQLSSLR